MFEFEIIQELKPNDEILEIIKGYNYTVKNGKIKHLKATNLQFIEPTEYLITYPTTFTISKVIEMDSIEQNRVALYLFNSINFKIKNYKSIDIKEQIF